MTGHALYYTLHKESLMRKALSSYVNAIGWFNERLGKGAGYVIWGLVGLMFYEAICRSAFNAPHLWLPEITQYIFWGYVFLGGGYVFLHGGHIRMDVLYSRWSPRRRAIVDVATFSVAAFYLVGLLWKCSYYTAISIMAGERQVCGIHTYVGPIKAIMVLGIILVLLEAVAFFIKDVHLAISGKVLE